MKGTKTLFLLMIEIAQIDNRSVPNSDGRMTPFVIAVGLILLLLLPYTIKALSLWVGLDLNASVFVAIISHLGVWLASSLWQEKLRGMAWLCYTIRKLDFKERIGLIRIIRERDPLFFRLIG